MLVTQRGPATRAQPVPKLVDVRVGQRVHVLAGLAILFGHFLNHLDACLGNG